MDINDAYALIEEAKQDAARVIDFMEENEIAKYGGPDWLSAKDTQLEIEYYLDNLYYFIENWQYEQNLARQGTK